MGWTIEEREAALVAMTGYTWAQMAAEHDMRCGACRGMLRLDSVEYTQSANLPTFPEMDARLAAMDRGDPLPPLPPDYWTQFTRPAVTCSTMLLLICDQCGARISMPIHSRESA